MKNSNTLDYEIASHFAQKLQKILLEELENPKPITIMAVEYDMDMFDYYDTDNNEDIELNEEAYEAFNKLKEKPLHKQEVTFCYEDSFKAFHTFVWESLSFNQKTVAVAWFWKFLAKSNGRKMSDIIITNAGQEPLEYKYDEEKGDYVLYINPFILNYSAIESYIILHKIIEYNFYDHVNTEYNRFATSKKSYIDKYLIANIAQGVKDNPKVESFLLGKTVSEAEEKDIAIITNQPLQYEVRKKFEDLQDYMLAAEEELKVEDSLWQMYQEEVREEYERIDQLFSFYFGEDREGFYNRYFKEGLDWVIEEKNNLSR